MGGHSWEAAWRLRVVAEPRLWEEVPRDMQAAGGRCGERENVTRGVGETADVRKACACALLWKEAKGSDKAAEIR